MKLTVFQSDKGDCILITSKDEKNILADGGMTSSYVKFVKPALSRLHKRKKKIDLAYVSHIDQDHIAGILKLMDNIVDWKIHKYQVANGNTNHKRPDPHEPPEVKKIWHNSFHEQVGKNAGPIEEMLAANSSLLSLQKPKWAQQMAEKCGDLATSMTEAAKLSRRIGQGQLNIPLNPEYNGGLMYVADPTDRIKIGKLNITVIGPCEDDLKNLRKEWNKWLRSQKGRRAIRKIREDAREDEERLNWSEFDRLIMPILIQADELGDRDKVTPPNLASLMLLVEEDSKTVLMTGDGHADDILWGLENTGNLNSNGNMHVNVLKVQHHGSEHNTHREFCKRVTADHYIFCGNGAHENPNLDVVQEYIESRIGPASRRSRNAEADNRFKMWFNSSSGVTESKYRKHMRSLERKIKREARRSDGQMRYAFLNNSSFQLSL